MDIINHISFFNRPKLPVILQTEMAECGLATLAMISSYFGHQVELHELRHRFNVSLKGTTFNDLIKFSSHLNLDARPVKVNLEYIEQLSTPCILHWDLNHFVVLKGFKNNKALIHDPALGERKLSYKELDKHYTGVSLEFSPNFSFEKRKTKPTIKLSDVWKNIIGTKTILFQVFVLSLLIQVLAIAGPFYMQLVLDDVVVSYDKPLLTTLAIGFLLVLLFNIVITGVRSLVILFLSSTLSFQFASNLFQHLLKLPLGYFEKRHMGDIVSRFGSNTEIKDFLVHGAVSVIVDSIMALVTFSMMFLYSPKLSIIVLLSVSIYISGRLFLYQPFKLRTEESVVVTAKSDSNFMETVRGMQSIKIFGKEQDRKNLWLKRYADVINADIRLGKFRIAYDAFNNLIMGIENIIIIFITANMVLDNSFSIGMMIAFIAYKIQFTGKTSTLIEQLIQFKMLDIHLARLSDISTHVKLI